MPDYVYKGYNSYIDQPIWL
uniref:Uncharacterized protein n=1 Tax=Anguilla anguilla TaxID=7936 RepID=A0A0E9QNV7_ANGAN